MLELGYKDLLEIFIVVLLCFESFKYFSFNNRLLVVWK